MEKPYEKDLNFLREELNHHTYIAKKFAQEHDTNRAQEFESLCEELRTTIKIVEQKQSTAISEWSALSEERRQIIIMPLLDAVEKFSNDVEKSGCPVFATYLEQFLSNYLSDLIDFDR